MRLRRLAWAVTARELRPVNASVETTETHTQLHVHKTTKCHEPPTDVRCPPPDDRNRPDSVRLRRLRLASNCMLRRNLEPLFRFPAFARFLVIQFSSAVSQFYSCSIYSRPVHDAPGKRRGSEFAYNFSEPLRLLRVSGESHRPHVHPLTEQAILPLLPSRTASPHFGRHSISVSRRVGG